MRQYIRFAFLLLLPSMAVAQQQKSSRPNIIFILSDDHAYQAIGAYGNKYAKTPNIDRIAREGALMVNNVVANSICGPSRATLLTGKYSHMNGYKNNDATKFNVNQTLFSNVLKNDGYQTAWIGKLHLNSLPTGFSYWSVLPGQGNYYNPDFITIPGDTVRKQGYVTDLITEKSIDWLDKRNKSKPFFLVIGHKAVHREWNPDVQDLGAYDNVKFPLPKTFFDNYEGRTAAMDQDMTIDKTMVLSRDLKVHADYLKDDVYARLDPERKKLVKAYYDKISKEFDDKKLTGRALVEWKYQRYIRDYLSVANSLDRNIGKVLQYVDKHNLKNNTVIIYASDQGFYMGEHGWFDKRFIYEQSLKTPFLIRYPGVVAPGTKINQLVSNIDWAPTVLDLAKSKIPSDMQGKSFVPLFNKSDAAKANWRKAAYYHYYEFPQPHHVYPHFGLRTERYTLVRFYGAKNFWELYDLREDPDQIKNIYGQKQVSAITQQLKKQLDDLIIQYKDDEAAQILASEK